VENTAVGDQALINNTGNFNTAVGFRSLLNNTGGNFNTAVGDRSLQSNTTGFDNAALGRDALFNNTTGAQNTAVGRAALSVNTDGPENTAIGVQALETNTTGGLNIAAGYLALRNNTTGDANTAVGERALLNNTTGSFNTALGALAGTNVVTANNVVCINSRGGDVLGSTWIGNIFGTTTQNPIVAPVVVSADGQLGTAPSAERFKKDIATMEKASEAILSLRPVTFHYKTDSKATAQFGLIAEEVAKVNPSLVVLDKEGKPYTVRYDAVNAMLLNEFLKEHRKVEQQEATITQLKKDFEATVAQLATRLDEQAAQIQKVSAQLEASKPSPQVVNNP
jgi:hypothetical protein